MDNLARKQEPYNGSVPANTGQRAVRKKPPIKIVSSATVASPMQGVRRPAPAGKKKEVPKDAAVPKNKKRLVDFSIPQKVDFSVFLIVI